MNAIILAAGLGSRLSEATKIIPKCLIEVNGKTIIENQIESLIGKVKKIIIIGGYKFDTLRKYINNKYPNNKDIILINNENYESTNNMYSFTLSKKYSKNKDIILMNGDVFFDKTIIEDLLLSDISNQIVCDDTQYNDESMKITLKESNINSISKTISKEESSGCSIDIYKFSKKATNILFKIIDKDFFKKNNFKSWTELAINEMFNKIDVKPLYIEKKWYEIDNMEDLRNAEKVFKW